MKIFKKIAAFVLCGILLLSALIFLSDKKAVMAYMGNYIGYTDITGQNLKNATNTLDVEIIDRQEVRTPNSNTVKDGSPQLTILTHGLDGKASHWSNNYYNVISGQDEGFAYDPESLIEQLRNKAQDAVVYWAQIKGANIFKLIECNNKLNNGQSLPAYTYYNGSSDVVTVDRITDISKHIIVVFEATGSATSGTNDAVYEQLDYMTDKLVYDIAYLNGGELPKVNLIGHSRGGITNLQYALEHPALVDSIFSMGTPYLGSNLGEFPSILETVGYSPTDPGVKDIMSEDLQNKYRDKWNNNYENEYSHIKAHAIGGFSTLDFINYVALKDEDYTDIKIDLGITAVNAFVKIFPLVEIIKIDMFFDKIMGSSLISPLLSTLYDTEPIRALLSEVKFGNVLNFKLRKHLLYDDLFIDLESQHATGYTGFIKRSRCFDVLGINSDYPYIHKVSVNAPPIVHNLEARDPEIINYIISNIDLGSSENILEYSVNNDGTITIISANIPSSGYEKFYIPETIDGRTVTMIGNYAFKGKNIESIYLPDTVTYIGRSAFAGCQELINAVIYNNSGTATDCITEIGDMAFAGCINLENFGIPQKDTQGNTISGKIAFGNQLISVGNRAFIGTKIKSIIMQENLSYIGIQAFFDCQRLITFEVSTTSQNYRTIDGVLYKKDNSILLCYPGGKINASFTLPDSVQIIGSYAFSGNGNLTDVDLNNVYTVLKGGLEGCTNLNNITASNLMFLEDTLMDTAWLNNQNDYISLGNVLIKYNGDESVIDLTGYVTVSDFAFAFNDNITTIYSGHDVINIGSYTFIGCNSLSKAVINNPNYIIFAGEGSFDNTSENLIINVPKPLLQDYLSNEFWAAYTDNIDIPETEIIFNSLGGSACPNGTVKYYDYLSLSLPTRQHYTFEGWYSEQQNGVATRQLYDSTTIWSSLEETVTLYAKWEPVEYLITMYPNGGELILFYYIIR